MATNVVEQIIIELGLDTSKFAADAEKASKKNKELAKSLSDTEKASKKTEKAQDELSKKQHDAIEQIAKMGQGFAKATKELTKLFGVIIGSTGLFKLANDTARANLEMSKLSGQLGMSTKSLTDWQNAAGAFGGNAQGMTASLTGIKQAMNGLVMFGDASMLPYFNALGVSVVNNAGKVRQLDDVMLDLADAFQKMPQDQAYTIGKKMGFDDGTINMLVSGRKEMQEILAIQNQMYHSSQQSIALSKELTRQQTILNAHWQSMKQMVGDALTPVLIGLIKIVNGFFEFLQRHEKVVTTVFKVAALVIGMLLIPTLLSATRTLLGFIAPFTPLIKVFGLLGAAISPVTLLITALAAAVVLLYDDYKTWSEGGKSLFDWGAFSAGIKECKLFVDALSDSFANMARAFSDMAISMIASATGEKKEDISGFIGESVYRLMHGGKTFEEVEGVTPQPTSKPIVIGKGSPAKAAPADAAVKAAQFATSHAKPGSTGYCGRYVMKALSSQGIKVWADGKDLAGELLKRNDFEQIAYNSNYVPQIGDIMSLPKGFGQHAKAGHVAIWNGHQWVSDYIQKQTFGNTAATNPTSYQNILKGASVPTIARMKTSGASVAPVHQNKAKPVASKGNATAPGKWSQTKDAFVKKYYSAAVAVSKGLNGAISPEGILAQWALETGWGTKVTPGTGYNLGNHKADANWKGARTKEKILDQRTGRRDYYRFYTESDLVKESIKFLSTQKYAKVRSAKNDQEAFKAMEDAGYAEGANYAKTIMQINNDIKAHVKAGVLAAQAQQAQRMVAQNQQTHSSVVKNDNRKHVNVNINNVNVNTSAKTVSGNVVAAVKGVNNYLINQIGASMT